jgi:hypothetical protein
MGLLREWPGNQQDKMRETAHQHSDSQLLLEYRDLSPGSVELIKCELWCKTKTSYCDIIKHLMAEEKLGCKHENANIKVQ